MSTLKFIFELKSLSRLIFSLLLILQVLFTNHLFSQNKGNTFRFPAEFEQQQAVWLSWDNEDPWAQATIGNIVKGLFGKVPVKIATSNAQVQKSAKETLYKMGIDVSFIQFHILPGARLWIRDNGAQFLV